MSGESPKLSPNLTRRIAHPSLAKFFFDALTAVGVPAHIAKIEAEIGSEVDLCGVHSHGARLLLGAINNIRNGPTNPDPEIRTLVDFPASVLAETDCGIGRYVSHVGMEMAIERAEKFGVGVCTIRGVAHWGRGYSYGLQAARAGMIGLAFTNAYANFPAWGTSVPSLGNNPIAIGVPSMEDGEPVVMDIAMTQTAIGRVNNAAADGQKIPYGWGLDTDGNPTDDPQKVLDSERFLPMGAHKGSSLSFMTDLITGALAGGLLCFEQGTEGRPSDSEGGSTKMFVAIKPYGEWLGTRVAELKAHLHSVATAPEQGDVRWPGENSFRWRKEYLAHGIALPGNIGVGLDGLAQELGIEIGWM